MAVIVLAVIIFGSIVGGLVISSTTSTAHVPTVALLPSPTQAFQPTEPPAAAPTITPTTTSFERATLPPTWTLSPTSAASPSPTLTPTPATESGVSDAPTAYPTLSAALLADTYWEGDGTESMWDHELPGGTFGRFTIFPVNFWVGTTGGMTLTAEHEAAIENAINEINQVVPIQRVSNRIFAHMTLWLMTDAEFNRNVGCPAADMTVGCSSSTYTDVGILLVTIWLRVTDQDFASTLLHELTHGLGIAVHSPYPQDIMYAFDAGQPPHYTQRDLNTLRALYSAPPFNPRSQE